MVWGGGVIGVWTLSVQMCWRASLRWPLAKSMDVGRCLHNILDVRPGQGVKYLASVALHQVSTTCLKQAMCRNCTRAVSVFMWYALFSNT